MNKECWQQNGTHIYQGDDLQFVGPRQQIQITEYKQQYQSYHGLNTALITLAANMMLRSVIFLTITITLTITISYN